ncbi:MAG: hypothetical protein Fur005_49510 [Roseiflexaceae bacterium]
MSNHAQQADLRRQLKARLLDLSPRAFELFASDLLTYIGLRNVRVTRYVGDLGIDAFGDLALEDGLIRVPTGVQVKRYRQNIQRSEIDRFIGALAGQCHHGIFITTSGYAEQARIKAKSSPLMRIDTLSGDDLVRVMQQKRIGLHDAEEEQIDESYFAGFEAQSAGKNLTDPREAYLADSTSSGDVVAAAEDLISLRALSYDLRVDPNTIRDWIERGKLLPDRASAVGYQQAYFFRRDRIEAIRNEFIGTKRPHSGDEWRQAFLEFAATRTMTRSYKPVLLLALFQTVDHTGMAMLDQVATEFLRFYQQRQQQGLPIEFEVPLLADPANLPLNRIKQLIIKYPLERFIIQGFLSYDPQQGRITFAPYLWQELRASELLDLRRRALQQLDYYYQHRAK